MKNIYLLKDLARLSGFSTYTIKYYLKLGLLEEIGRSPITNFRYFDDTSRKRLQKIKEMRAERFSLKEIQQTIGQ
jgi:DNA-binding transcriptional MerR regulator